MVAIGVWRQESVISEIVAIGVLRQEIVIMEMVSLRVFVTR